MSAVSPVHVENLISKKQFNTGILSLKNRFLKIWLNGEKHIRQKPYFTTYVKCCQTKLKNSENKLKNFYLTEVTKKIKKNTALIPPVL